MGYKREEKGYKVEWGDAPFQRERVLIAAHSGGPGVAQKKRPAGGGKKKPKHHEKDWEPNKKER